MSFLDEYSVWRDPLILTPVIIIGMFMFLVVMAIIDSYETWLELKATIPNMDCSELIQTQNKYEYWLDGEHKDSWFFETHDLFDMWYEAIKGKECY